MKAIITFILLSPALCVDWALGVFVQTQDRSRGHSFYPSTIKILVTSFLHNHHDAKLALVTDATTADQLIPQCEFVHSDATARCLLISHNDALAREGAGRFVRHSTIHSVRHVFNSGALKLLADHGSGLGPDSLVLLTDVRDVVFEDDLFKRIRARNDGLAAGQQGLYFALEPSKGSLGQEPWNRKAMAQCFPPAVVANIGEMPPSCSGTTVGSMPAIQRYVQAMKQLSLFCSGHGIPPLGGTNGMDQPAHMYLLYDIIMCRRGEPGWLERYGPMFQAIGVDPWAVRYPFHPNAATEPAYAALHAIGQALAQGNTAFIPLHSHTGEICTMGLVNVSSDDISTIETGFRFPGSPITAPHCAVVHQYDRSPPLLWRFLHKWLPQQYPGMPVRAPVLNLDSRSDRWQRLVNDWKAVTTVGLERVSALPHAPMPHQAGRLINGCTASHIKAAEEAFAANPDLQVVLLLEDDAVPRPNFDEIFPHVLEYALSHLEDWHIINLGTSRAVPSGDPKDRDTRQARFQYRSPYLLRTSVWSATQALLINRRLLPFYGPIKERYVRHDLTENESFADFLLSHDQNIVTLVTVPLLTVQASSYSDIRHKVTSYDHLFAEAEGTLTEMVRLLSHDHRDWAAAAISESNGQALASEFSGWARAP